MSVRSGAPYADRIEENGRVLIYEGHDIAQRRGGADPKKSDQPRFNPSGSPTQNGYFYQSAIECKEGRSVAERVKVYEKIRNGIWVYNGYFDLVDAWVESSPKRKVFKFKLRKSFENTGDFNDAKHLAENDRFIPSTVKLAVWKRDQGKCVKCGAVDHLHYDHIIPYSKGGSSLVEQNIQILCARHNLEKRDRIE